VGTTTLKAHDPNIMIVAVEPSSRQLLSKPLEEYPIIKGITDGIIPQIFQSGLVDRVFSVTDTEAIEIAHQLAMEEGIFCGISSGASVRVSMHIASELGPGKRIVTVLPDSRDRYLTQEEFTT
jgi:cysteine synthase A